MYNVYIGKYELFVVGTYKQNTMVSCVCGGGGPPLMAYVDSKDFDFISAVSLKTWVLEN